MLDAARPNLFRIIGPNTLGLMIPPAKLNASFAHMAAKPGNIALLSQSGAIATSLIDWAADNNVGFSHIVSLGDMADVDVGDYLDMLAGDAKTRAIVMYLETIPNPRKFMSAARAAARIKPVIAVKSGRHAAGREGGRDPYRRARRAPTASSTRRCGGQASCASTAWPNCSMRPRSRPASRRSNGRASASSPMAAGPGVLAVDQLDRLQRRAG